MAKTYSTLYSDVISEIDKRIGKEVVTSGSRYSVQPDGEGGSINSRSLATIVANVVTELGDLIEARIISGLDVTATDPSSDSINISAGVGTSNGRKWEILTDTTLQIPFDSSTYVFYVVLFNNAFEISRTHDNTRCEICKIIVPNPGTTSAIVDDKPSDGYDAWIVSAKDIVYDEDQEFDDASIEKLRDIIGDVLADNLIGNITLSENLKITNAQGSLEIDSESVKIFSEDDALLAKFNRKGTFFYDNAGVEVAKFSVDEARIGNIRIMTNAIQSGNFIENSSGFRIRDDGDAEFNNIRLRGTLYTSTIAENIYINPGILFIGDMNLNDDIALLAGKKVIFDRDLGADTYWVYNSVTAYLEGWVDGVKRIEL